MTSGSVVHLLNLADRPEDLFFVAFDPREPSVWADSFAGQVARRSLRPLSANPR